VAGGGAVLPGGFGGAGAGGGGFSGEGLVGAEFGHSALVVVEGEGGVGEAAPFPGGLAAEVVGGVGKCVVGEFYGGGAA
jgi:hypothetical protein